MKTPLASAASLVLLGALLGTTGCSYPGNRLMDLTDIIDIKYGVALGAGVKAELTTYAGTGVGIAALGYSREWYGRRSFVSEGCVFFHAIALGVDGGHHNCAHDEELDSWTSDRYETYFLLANLSALGDHGHFLGYRMSPATEEPVEFPPPPMIDRWRFGGEFIIPLVHFGIYINFGEIYDFLVGFTTYDPAQDDGVSKLEIWTLPEPVPERTTEKSFGGPPTPSTLRREREEQAVEEAGGGAP